MYSITVEKRTWYSEPLANTFLQPIHTRAAGAHRNYLLKMMGPLKYHMGFCQKTCGGPLFCTNKGDGPPTIIRSFM